MKINGSAHGSEAEVIRAGAFRDFILGINGAQFTLGQLLVLADLAAIPEEDVKIIRASLEGVRRINRTMAAAYMKHKAAGDAPGGPSKIIQN